MGMHQWAKRIDEAVTSVFELMMGSRPVTVNEQCHPAHFDLNAIIGLAGQPTGILGISCEIVAASKIAFRMLGSEMPGSADEARDALGEVCNMVAGSLKSSLPKPEDRCQISVPAVISGTDYHVKSLLYGEKYRVAFRFEGEPMTVTLQIQS
jgi:chemotaxis protein CheX